MKKDDERHSFIRLDSDAQVIIGLDTSYLSECGVLDTFISSRFYHNLYQINEISSTLSLYGYRMELR